MKIYIPRIEDNKERFGGGWTFLDNFIKGLNWAYLTNTEAEADIIFIPGATQIPKDYILPKDKKVVLRVDNALRNSRNRNSGMTRMCQLAERADLIIYQSQWARNYLSPVINKNKTKEKVILNGADPHVFRPDGERIETIHNPVCLYLRSSNHENKGWEMAWYDYQSLFRNHPNAILYILGRFSEENIGYNFDFFNNERYEYKGFITDPEELAKYYRSADVLYLPFLNDACSNTYIEAKLSGIKNIVYHPSGGSPEISQSPVSDLTIEAMGKNYKNAFEDL